MDAQSKIVPASIDQAVLKAKVAQICEHVGYHAITQDSYNILVDIYHRLVQTLGRHCKEYANYNCRVESTMIDLVQAYDSVGISIPGLQEHIETVKLPINIDLVQDIQESTNRIQRNLLVDDLLENEKNSHLENNDDGEKATSEMGIEDDKPSIPLLKDSYEEISSKFNDIIPVTADKKIRLGGRIVLVANTKLKINPPILPDKLPSTSTKDSKASKQTKSKRQKKTPSKAPKITTTPPDPAIAEPPQSFFPIIETTAIKTEADEPVVSLQIPTPSSSTKVTTPPPPAKQPKVKRKKKTTSNQFAIVTETLTETVTATPKKESFCSSCKGPVEDESIVKCNSCKEQSKNKRQKKISSKPPKVIVTPLDPAIAEPPSFFPILEATAIKVETDEPVAPLQVPTPSSSVKITTPPPAIKPPKIKKKKKTTSSQFAIVTETVTDNVMANTEKEWFCPACGGPDDGDLMVQCDTCQDWYHLGCTNLHKPPEDDENWECELCINKAKLQKQQRPQTPVIVGPKKPKPAKQSRPQTSKIVESTTKMKVPKQRPQTPMDDEPNKVKTPEPIIESEPKSLSTPVASGSNQDDLCPECNLSDDGTMMIQCDDPHCAKWFHGKCVNLLEEPKEDESWFCKVCVDKQQSAFKRRRRAK